MRLFYSRKSQAHKRTSAHTCSPPPRSRFRFFLLYGQARIKGYFADLIPRIVFHHSSPGLSAMERSSIGDGAEAPPTTPGPVLSALQLDPVGTAGLPNIVPTVPPPPPFCFVSGLVSTA